MSNFFIGEIRMFGFNFAPKGWAFCNGQTLAIAQNQALFALLGTTYGGNGQTTFALPNLQSQVGVGWGQGPGLSNYVLGQTGGTTAVTIDQNTLAAHTHTVKCNSAIDNTTPNVPKSRFWARENNGDAPYNSDGLGGFDTMHSSAITATGGSQPHTNLQPSLNITFCIALQGIFPSRN